MNLQPTTYFGKTRHLRALENYHITFSYHNSKENIPKHHHENPYFSLNLGAPYLENNGFSEKIIEPGTVLIRPSGYEHQNSFTNKPGLCFNIELVSTSNLNLLQLCIANNITFSGIEFLQILARVYTNYYLDNELDIYITEVLTGKLNTKTSINIPFWNRQVIDKIEEDYSSSLSLRKLADSVSLHPNYLARKFKIINGVTIGEYIRMTRIKNACLMFYSKKRLTDISLESGFYDQSHFSNVFQSTFNIAPKELRNFI